jgi:hypothetical protein
MPSIVWFIPARLTAGTPAGLTTGLTAGMPAGLTAGMPRPAHRRDAARRPRPSARTAVTSITAPAVPAAAVYPASAGNA